MAKLFLFLCLLAVCTALRTLKDPVVKRSRVQKQARGLFDDSNNPNYKTDFFTTKIDHFSYTNSDTFKMKYLYNNTFYKQGGPIFFYTGNEGDVEDFAEATGIIFDLAPKFNAAIIFAEHRFYGSSMPFVNNNISYESLDHVGLLTSQQALADYADFLLYLKSPNSTFEVKFPSDIKIIAFGGSYGGMLSAWMRMKYPHIIAGAWASSAPLLYFRGAGVDEGAFDHITTRTYAESGCNNFIIQNTWKAVQNMSSTPEGRAKLTNIYHLDPPMTDGPTGADNLNGFIREAIEYMAMTDYPYPTSFLEPMPGYPVVAACLNLNAKGTNFTDEQIVTYMYQAVGVYYNSTGTVKSYCIDPSKCGDPGTSGLGDNGALGWPWQECSEIIIDMCAKGMPNDFFWDECTKDNIANLADGCKYYFSYLKWTTKVWNVDAVKTTYGFDLSGTSNIILTQGRLDPWSGGGYQKNNTSASQSRGIYVVEIPSSAHHLDLRTPNFCDPNTISFARFQIVDILSYFAFGGSSPPTFQDLPSLQQSNFNQSQCKYIQQGYPWGQRRGSAAGTLSLTAFIVMFYSIFN
ncbi:unnamed protein product [Auanema sp. JU1783]|nr:unnamed protein product [Auanema sp. JU1783]